MWKSKVAKVLRNSGKAYQSLSKLKIRMPERKVGPPCGEKCRLKCKEKIDEISRQHIFDAVWGLSNLDRQREFVVRHSQKIKPKYRYSSTQDFRALNTAFYFDVNGSKIRPSTSSDSFPSILLNTQPLMSSNPQQPTTHDAMIDTGDTLVDPQEVFSPEVVRPLPKAGPRKSIANRKRRKTAILTDTPEKENLRKEQDIAKNKKTKGVNKKAKVNKKVEQ
ncbi:unnamed protein product, partial [Leptidea sinapis]